VPDLLDLLATEVAKAFRRGGRERERERKREKEQEREREK